LSTPLLCGEVHYFRVPSSLWMDRLLKLKRAGANCVSTYVPWNWHMPREGMVVFHDGYSEWHVPSYFSRDLKRYLEAAGRLGLRVVLRPGPYICSEWDSGGHPNWVYAKTTRLRSLDPSYISLVEEWYRLVFKEVGEYSGLIDVVQVENEYFWGNREYIEYLGRLAARYMPGKIIVTNENPYVESMANTIDSYPAPWSISEVDSKLVDYVNSQPGMFKMFMELQGGWFTANRYGFKPTNRLSIPASWTEMMLKTSIARGVYNVNIYMFHGGSNPGYYTGKYISSSYDFEAAVREWGELSERYYAVKRVYYFTRYFRDLLVDSRPAGDSVKPLYKCSDTVARSSSNGFIVLLRNTSDWVCYQKILVGSELIPPGSTGVEVPPLGSKLILVDYSIPGTPFRLKYGTLEPLAKLELGSTVLLLLYGRMGEELELLLESSEPLHVSSVTGLRAESRGRAIAIKGVVNGLSQLASVESGGSRLLIVVTDKWRAGRTWIIDELGDPVVLVGGVYLARDAVNNGGELRISLELDEDSCGRLLLITNPGKGVGRILVNGVEASIEELTGGVYSIQLPSHLCTVEPGYRMPIRELSVIDDPVDYAYREVEPGKPLEHVGYYSNGFYIYRLRFRLGESEVREALEKGLAVVGVNDYGVALINNEYAGSGYHVIESVNTSMLREGWNELRLLVESTGHMNDGLIHVPNGFNGGLYIGVGEHIVLRGWRRINYAPRIGPGFDIAEFLSNPWRYMEGVNEGEYSEVEFPEGGGLYVKEVYIGDLNGRFILDLGYGFYYNHPPRILVFINDKYLGPYRGLMDVTGYLKQGVNKIALFTDWFTLYPVLRRYSMLVEGSLEVQEGFHGIVEEWFRENPGRGSTVKLPLELNGAGRVVWLKGVFELPWEPSPLRPVKIAVESSGVRLLVFVNGNLVGRIYDDSPSRELYVPEPALKQGLNELVIVAVTTSTRAVVDRIEVSDYYRHRLVELSVRKNA